MVYRAWWATIENRSFVKHVLRTSSLLLVGAPLVDDGLIVTVVVFGTGTRGRAVVGSARGHNNNDERGRCVIGKGR